MSYILEALKKLERKRQQEEVRPALMLADVPKPEARSRAFWLTLVAAGLVLNAMILVWWIVFRGPYHPPRSAPAAPQRTLLKPVPPAVPSPVTSTTQAADRPKTVGERTPTPAGSKGPEDRKAPAAPPEKLPVSAPVKTANACREADPVSGDFQESGGPAPPRTAPSAGADDRTGENAAASG